MFVEKKRWLTAEEFNDLLRALPVPAGPQYRQPHLGVWLADARADRRDRGLDGISDHSVLRDVRRGVLYERYGDVEAVRRVLSGVAPAAAGLIIATVRKMAAPLFRSFGPAPLVVLATAFAIGLMRWPLVLVLIVVLPVSIGLAWRGQTAKKP